MMLSRYKNEFIAFLSLLMILFAFMYKTKQEHLYASQKVVLASSIYSLQEILSLQEIWAQKGFSKKIDSLKKVIPQSKTKWSKKGKKLTLKYQDLNTKELNKIVTKVLNLPVQIVLLNIHKEEETYTMELKCKW